MRAFSVRSDGTLSPMGATDLGRLAAATGVGRLAAIDGVGGDRIEIHVPFGADLDFFVDEDDGTIFIEAIVPEDLHVGEEHIKDMIVAWAASMDVQVKVDDVEVFVGQSTALPPPDEQGADAELDREFFSEEYEEPEEPEEDILMGPGMDGGSGPTPIVTPKQKEKAPAKPGRVPAVAPPVSAPARQQGAE